MARKRSHGEGSVYLYRGRWRAELRLNYRRLVRDFGTKKAALDWLAEVRVQAGRGLLPEPSKLTLASYLEHWLQAAGPSLRPGSVATYRQAAEYIIPVLGQARLQALKPAEIQGLYGRLLDRGLSPATVRICHTLLHRALSQAVDWGLLAQNPADRAKPPRAVRKEFRVLQAWELARLLEAAAVQCPEFYPMVATLALTGMRLAEATGLRWSDVDLEAGVIRVSRALRRVGARWVETEPKSAAGRRQIPIPAPLVELLKRHRRTVAELRLKAGSAWETAFGDLVFPTAAGRPREPSNVRKALARACHRAGLPRLRVHDLRHSHATLLLSWGVHPRVVQERLGHSTVTLTLQTYSHVLPDLQREAAERLGEILAGSL